MLYEAVQEAQQGSRDARGDRGRGGYGSGGNAIRKGGGKGGHDPLDQFMAGIDRELDKGGRRGGRRDIRDMSTRGASGGAGGGGGGGGRGMGRDIRDMGGREHRGERDGRGRGGRDREDRPRRREGRRRDSRKRRDGSRHKKKSRRRSRSTEEEEVAPKKKSSNWDIRDSSGVGMLGIGGEQASTLKIPQHMVSRIIGTQGGMINSIQDQCGCKLHIDQSTKDLGYSLLNIQGRTPADVIQVENVIIGLIALSALELKQGGAGTTAASSGGEAPPPAAPDSVTATINVPQEHVGKVVGVGGTMLAVIQDKTGTEVTVDQSTKELGFSVICVKANSREKIQMVEAIIENLTGQMSQIPGQMPPPGIGGDGVPTI